MLVAITRRGQGARKFENIWRCLCIFKPPSRVNFTQCKKILILKVAIYPPAAPGSSGWTYIKYRRGETEIESDKRQSPWSRWLHYCHCAGGTALHPECGDSWVGRAETESCLLSADICPVSSLQYCHCRGHLLLSNISSMSQDITIHTLHILFW